MKLSALALLFVATSTLAAPNQWTDAKLTNKSTVNEWCRHCPDWNKTRYSFEIQDGMTYVAETHRTLDVTLNGHNSLRVEKDGHVGDVLHVLDDAGKDRKLRIIERIAAKKALE